MDKSLTIGYVVVFIATLAFLFQIMSFVDNLSVPKWLRIILDIIGIILWFSGLAFLNHVDKLLSLNKKNKND